MAGKEVDDFRFPLDPIPGLEKFTSPNIQEMRLRALKGEGSPRLRPLLQSGGNVADWDLPCLSLASHVGFFQHISQE